MSQIEINFKGHVAGRIILPASKSISNRALVMNAVRSLNQEKVLQNISDCDDSNVVVRALEQLKSCPTGNIIDIGAAGTAMRFLTAYLCVVPGENTITGTERMLHRPIGILVDALRKLGAEIEYLGAEGFPPLRITGHNLLEGGEISIPGNVSSQYISALMMIEPRMEHGLELHLADKIVSRPYIEMTHTMMRQFACDAETYYIENDWSAASYCYEIACLSHEANIILPGLFKKSIQGDSRVAELFRTLGVETKYTKDEDGLETVVLQKAEVVDKEMVYEQNLVDQPDLAQTLVATCCALGRKFRFTGLENLRIKETDRLTALKTELKKLGFIVEIVGAGSMEWMGDWCTPSGEALDTYEDHRMAMALAPMAIVCGPVKMNDPEVVSKSYPNYWNNLKAMGFKISRNE